MTKMINGDLYSDLITSASDLILNSSSRDEKTITHIVIHHNATTNKDVAIGTWVVGVKDSQPSAHYEITDTEIIGCVGENFTSHHSGNYDFSQRSIGLEHVNSTGAPDWQVSDKTLANSARLIVDICKRYNIPIDRTHIIGHNEVVPTACPGGINVDLLVKNAQTLVNGGEVTPAPNPTPTPSKNKTGLELFKADKRFTLYKDVKVDEMKFHHGIWQFVSYGLNGSNDINWDYNGIPLECVDNITRGNEKATQVGDIVRFNSKYNHGTIDYFDEATQAVGIIFGGYGVIWFNANALAFNY